MKDFKLWLGTEEALANLEKYEAMYTAPEYLAFYDEGDDEPTLDKNFNVLNDRKGLYIMERFGDKAVIKVHGSLTNTYSVWHKWWPGMVTSYEAIRDALAIAGNESGINEIYMDFATGGGVVRGLDTAADMIRRVKAVKPVYGHTDSHAFSAGYWLASSTSRLTASRMAEVGSIGTLMVIATRVEAAEKAGIKYHVFRAGEYKAIGLPYEDLTEEARAYLQDNLEKTNKFFLEHVSRSRNLMMSDQKQWGEGKTFFAEEGKQVGLIDGVTTLVDLMGSAASVTFTSDNRRFDMNISAEKLAQIAAGADPSVVLTAEELKLYQASLEEPAAEEPVAEEPAAEEPGSEAASAPAASADNAALLKEIGRLEAKLEAADEKLKLATTGLESLAAENAALATVAKVAVANLQTALGQPKAEKSTGTEIVAQFNDLQAQMATRFKVGQTTTTPIADTTKVGGTPSFRHNQ